MKLLLILAALACQEEKRAEAKRLEEKAARTTNEKERDRYLAEAWALRSEAFADEGQWEASREAWLRARAYGWTGPLPTGRPQDRRQGVTQDDEDPLGVRKPERPRDPTMWDRFAYRPFPGSRNGAVHNLIHLPPFEEASALPEGTWHFQGSLDFSLSKFSESGQGGETEWKTGQLSIIAEIDYSILSWLEAGVRVAVGELYSAGADIVVFQKGIQIVPPGERSFNLEWIVPRVKVAFPTPIVDIGGAVEFKIPIANEADYLTAGTFDLSLTAHISRKFGEHFAVHGNVGFTIPFGDTELFFDNSNFSTLPETNDISGVFHFAGGVVWRPFEIASFGLQVEGNAAFLENIEALDSGQFLIAGFGRLMMARDAYGALAIGVGPGDLSPDFYISFSVDLIL